MELIKKLGTRQSADGRAKQSWGLFACPYCKNEVERILGGGKRNASCGCNVNNIGHGFARHSGQQHPLYNIWKGMKKRCYSQKYEHFDRYGGRGIKVCDEWQDAETFILWALSNGWGLGLQIDRIDNDGHYEPSNCRFVTSALNNRNQSTTKLNATTVQEIRGLLRAGTSCGEIGKMYGVHRITVHDIAAGRTWQGII